MDGAAVGPGGDLGGDLNFPLLSEFPYTIPTSVSNPKEEGETLRGDITVPECEDEKEDDLGRGGGLVVLEPPNSDAEADFITEGEDEVRNEEGGIEKEEDLGGKGRLENFESPNSRSDDVEADSITEIKEGRGGGAGTTTVSSSSSTEDVSPDEGLEPKLFQGSYGSPAPTFPLRT